MAALQQEAAHQQHPNPNLRQIGAGDEFDLPRRGHVVTNERFQGQANDELDHPEVFTVEHVSHAHTPNIRSWVFRINKKVGPT